MHDLTSAPRRRKNRAAILAPLLLVAFSACVTQAEERASPSQDGTLRDPSTGNAPNANTLFSMSKILVARSRDAEAETLLMRVMDESPYFMPAYADLAQLYLRHERLDSAVEVLKSGVKVAPHDAVLWNNLGMCRMLQKRYDEALECFTTAAAGEPIDARARANMAVALGMLGRLDESLAVYLQLVTPSEAHHNLGVLCEARGDSERAQQEYALAASLKRD